jgi:hypothetical protein
MSGVPSCLFRDCMSFMIILHADMCKPCSGEQVFSAWMHVCAIRLFTESILRYGLPPKFLVRAILTEPVCFLVLIAYLSFHFSLRVLNSFRLLFWLQAQRLKRKYVQFVISSRAGQTGMSHHLQQERSFTDLPTYGRQ